MIQSKKESRMSDKPLFQNSDEQERIYAPEEVPGTDLPAQEVDASGTAGVDTSRNLEPPAAAPVANISTTPSGQAAPPNIGHNKHDTAPGDPEPQARYPIGDDDRDEIR
jgi:hypothetical protein